MIPPGLGAEVGANGAQRFADDIDARQVGHVVEQAGPARGVEHLVEARVPAQGLKEQGANGDDAAGAGVFPRQGRVGGAGADAGVPVGRERMPARGIGVLTLHGERK